MDKTYKNRYELKYILDYPTFVNIQKAIKFFLKEDPMGNSEGKYNVTSLYYDTRNLRFFWEKIDGEKKRVKLRLRRYESIDINKLKQKKSNNFVSIELKKRDDKTVSKKRAVMEEKDARAFIEAPILKKNIIKEAHPQYKTTLCEVAYLKSIMHLQPKLVISYTRQAFISKAGIPLRVTFDMNVKYRKDNLTLQQCIADKHVIMPNHIIMEVKYTNYLPLWLVNILQQYGCQIRTFSKYCTGIEHVLGEQDGMVY